MNLPAAEVSEKILTTVKTFEGNAPAADDLTLVVLRYIGA